MIRVMAGHRANNGLTSPRSLSPDCPYDCPCTVPTIVPAPRQNHVFSANASQVMRRCQLAEGEEFNLGRKTPMAESQATCAWRIAEVQNISCEVAILLGSFVRDLAVLFLHLLTTAAAWPAPVAPVPWSRSLCSSSSNC